DLVLLPGTASVARLYEISVLPPLGAPYGIYCQSNFPITTPGDSTPPEYAIQLPSRVALEGSLLSPTGTPVADVSIAATRSAAAPTEVCAATAGVALPTSTVSGKDGSYRLLL